MFNSVSQRQTASWSTELNAFSKSKYARKSVALLRAASSITQWRLWTCLCVERRRRNPSCEGSSSPCRSQRRYNLSVTIAERILYVVFSRQTGL